MIPRSHKVLYMLYLVIWIITAIHPKYPQDWLLENILVFLMFPFVLWLDKKFALSLVSLVLLLVFGSMHALGAHFTYAKMEYFDVLTNYFDFHRNYYDRVVHFAFGLLLFRPVYEIISRYSRSFNVALLFTFTTIVSISAFYEILEWMAAVTLRPGLGFAFVASQGDVWDSQKDILSAAVGALVNVVFLRSFYFRIRTTKKWTI